jgi:hypothetical protein
MGIGSLGDRGTLEELDSIARRQLDHRLLP